MTIHQNTFIQRVSLGLVLVCLFWMSYMMVPISQHLTAHHQSKHAMQHSTLACAWTCVSSNFIQAFNPILTNQHFPLIFILQAIVILMISGRTYSIAKPRPPPA